MLSKAILVPSKPTFSPSKVAGGVSKATSTVSKRSRGMSMAVFVVSKAGDALSKPGDRLSGVGGGASMRECAVEAVLADGYSRTGVDAGSKKSRSPLLGVEVHGGAIHS